MIEATDEMVRALLGEVSLIDGEPRAAVAAVLAIVERNRLNGPAAVRRALDEVVDAALPLAGGPLLPALKSLKRALDRSPRSAES